MNDLSALRLYMHHCARVKAKTLWQQLTTPYLSHYLADRAKAFGIAQVVVYQVSVGFLPGESLSYNNGEYPPPKLPQCVELIDSEGMLRLFLKENRAEIKDVRIVLFRGEELFPDWLWLSEIKQG